MSSQNDVFQPASVRDGARTDKEQYASSVSPARVDQISAASPSAQKATTRLGSLLRTLWAARGLFGGLLAIALAWFGQRALVEQSDSQTATRFYVIAIVLMILSLLHPAYSRGKRALAGDDVVGAPEGPDAVTVAPRTDLQPSPSSNSAAAELASVAPLPVRPARGHNREPMLEATVATTAPDLFATSHRFVPWTPEVDASPSPAAHVPTRAAKRQLQSKQASPHVASVGLNTSPKGWFGRWAAWRARAGWRVTAPGLLLVAALVTATMVVLRGNVASVQGGWLWVASTAVLFGTLIGLPGWPKAKSLLPGPKSDFFARGVPELGSMWSGLLLALVLTVALALRLINLEYHPGIFGDEGERGLEARNILGGDNRLIFGSGWWGVPNLYFYLVSFFLRTLGDHNMVADRMLSVISGVLAVWFVYRIGKLLWGVRVGLIAAAMLAVSPLALQFSRVAGESTPTGTLWTVGFFYLLLALRNRKWTDWALSGLAWGFSLYFYAAGKLIVPLVAVLGLYCLVRWRLDFFKKYALGFALLGGVMLLTAAPYILYSASQNWITLFGRAQETSIFSPINQGPTFGRYGLPYDPALGAGSAVQSVLGHPVAWGQVLFQQLRETVDVLFHRADQVIFYRIAEHGGSMFPPLWAAIVMLSLAYATWKAWDARFGLVSLVFWFGLLGSVLTIDTPNLQRVTGGWPVLMLLPAALLDRVFASAWPLNLSLARRWATVPLAAGLISFGADSYHEYFVHYPATCPYCDYTTQARYALSLGNEYKAFQMGVGGYDTYFNYGSTRFLAKDTEGQDMLAAPDLLPLTQYKGAAFIIYPNNNIYLPIIKLMYPDGVEEAVKSADDVSRFTSYKVSSEKLASFQVVQATYKPQNGSAVTRDEPNLGTDVVARPVLSTSTSSPSSSQAVSWAAPSGLNYPAQASWQGGLVAPAYGTYTFTLGGNAKTGKLEIDGHVVLGEGAPTSEAGKLVLAKGVHKVHLSGVLADASGKLSLGWSSDGNDPQPIESRFLYKGQQGGLSVEQAAYTGSNATETVKAPDPFAGIKPSFRHIDSFIGYRLANQIYGEAPFLMRFRGKLTAPVEGDYIMAMFPSSPAIQLLIDDKSVFAEGPSEAGNSVHLTAGSHDIDIRYIMQGGGRIELTWTPPNGQQELVPPTALTPLARSWLPSEIPDAPAAKPPAPTPTPTPTANIVAPLKVIGGPEAALVKPRGIAVDKAGNIYVGDRGNSRVVVFSPDGKVLHTWGKAAPVADPKAGGPAPNLAPGQFGEINDMSLQEVGAKVTVLVLDNNTRIQAFGATGNYVGTYDPAQLGFYAANGIGASSVGDANLYAAVTGQNKIAGLPFIQTLLSSQGGKDLPGGRALADAMQNIEGQDADKLEQPVDVVADPTNPAVIYLIDLKDRVAQLSLHTSATGPVGANWTVDKSWKVPVGRDDGGSRLGISPDGIRVYMSDPDLKRVDVVNVKTGEFSSFGAFGTEPGQFGAPSGVAVGADGKIYVLDSPNANIQVFSASSK